MGYLLALDDVVGSPRDAMLAHIANFVKVDFRATDRREQLHLAQALKRTGKKLVAEKVETHDEFQFAIEAGYDLFQGFFFAKPTLLRGQQLATGKLNGIRLLKEMQARDLDFATIEQIIRCDVALSYKLFRYVNSALFGRHAEISSIRQALMVLGDLGIRRFMTLATLPGLGASCAREVITHALVRAHFCELLAQKIAADEAQNAFLIGLFSLLDAMVDRSLPDILSELCLPKCIERPLTQAADDSVTARLYRAAVAYEAADWKNLERELATYALPHQTVTDAYLDSISWAAETCEDIRLVSETKVNGLETLGIEKANLDSLLAMERALAAGNTRVKIEEEAGVLR